MVNLKNFLNSSTQVWISLDSLPHRLYSIYDVIWVFPFINHRSLKGGVKMDGSVYKIIELVGTSDASWEDAAKTAVETAGESLKDLRVAEIKKLDLVITNGKVTGYRARVNISFKYHK
jgi:flavin-binding protein dodecin